MQVSGLVRVRGDQSLGVVRGSGPASMVIGNFSAERTGALTHLARQIYDRPTRDHEQHES